MQLISKLIAGMLLVFLCGIFATVILPRVYAAGMMADSMCLPTAEPPCPCAQKMKMGKCQPDPSNKFGCPCFDETSGFTTPGKCIATFKCQASSSDGKPPEMPKLPEPPKQPEKQPDQNQDPCSTGGASGNGGAFERSSATSTQASSTCPQNGSSQSFVSSGFDSSIFNTPSIANTSVPDLVSSLLGGTNASNGAGAAGGPANAANGTTATGTPASAVGTSEGVLGDIRIIGNGVTILASNRDSIYNKQTAGFSGSFVASGATAQSVYTSLCASRPWATGFIATIVPPSFFDGLCSLRGYKVGGAGAKSTGAASASGATTNVTKKQKTTTPPAIGLVVVDKKPDVIPEVDIWAVPASVSAGNRTTIFWSSKKAESCAVASGDGRFSQTGLSGGKASGALTTGTTFTISCTSSTGNHVNDFVTVNVI